MFGDPYQTLWKKKILKCVFDFWIIYNQCCFNFTYFYILYCTDKFTCWDKKSMSRFWMIVLFGDVCLSPVFCSKCSVIVITAHNVVPILIQWYWHSCITYLGVFVLLFLFLFSFQILNHKTRLYCHKRRNIKFIFSNGHDCNHNLFMCTFLGPKENVLVAVSREIPDYKIEVRQI